MVEVRPISREIARDITVTNHYSHSWNNGLFGVKNYGVFSDDRLLGAAVYGHPMNPKSWATSTTLNQGECLELNRLWIDDELGRNTETWMMGRTFRLLKADGVRLIQSFADGRLGVGTIYQAANFGYYGYHETVFFEDLNSGEFLHGTPFSNTAKTPGMLWRNHKLAQGKLKAFNVRTYRYLLPLDKRARKSIKLTPQPYPKERAGMSEIHDYAPPPGQVARCVALCEALGDPREDDFRLYLETLTGDPDTHIAAQRENRWVNALTSNAEPALF